MEDAAWQLDWVKTPSPLPTLIRDSCASFIESNPHVTIDESGLTQFVDSLDHTKLLSLPDKSYPLNFPTPRSEVNFLATLALLQIGSGWRVPLHSQPNGRGAAETMTFGCMGMHISGEITADVMTKLGLFEVAQLFGLKIQQEFQVSPGIYSERQTELYSLAEYLRRILNDTGMMLRNLACTDLYDFFTKVCASKVEELGADGEPKPPSVEPTLAKLVRHFKWLQDAYVLQPKKSEPNGQKEASAEEAASSSSSSSSSSSDSSAPRVVYVLKKAQLMIAELYLRFHKDPQLRSVFGYSDIDRLTVFSDNVLPAVLRATGVLKYSDSLAKSVDEGERIKKRDEECAIRASAIVACEKIVAAYNAKHEADGNIPKLTSSTLDYHLWLLGKKEEYRKLKRHSTYSGFY